VNKSMVDTNRLKLRISAAGSKCQQPTASDKQRAATRAAGSKQHEQQRATISQQLSSSG